MIEFSEAKILDALKWFFKKATKYEPVISKEAKKVTNDVPKEAKGNLRKRTTTDSNGFHIGCIYVQGYIPKLRKTLPFYDTLPLYIPMKMQGDRIVGFNLHYIPPSFRQQFFSAMIEHLDAKAKENKYESYTQVPLTQLGRWNYDWLFALSKRKLGAGKYGIISQTIRTYLFSHIVSQIKPIKPSEYEKAALVVLPQFKKKSATEIYSIIKEQFYK